LFKIIIKNSIKFSKKNNLFCFPPLIFGFLILSFAVIPITGSGINAGPGAHSLACFVLSFTVSLYFRTNMVKSPLLKGALLAGLYGTFIELIQIFIPYRSFELADIITNFSAAFTAMIPNLVFEKYLANNRLNLIQAFWECFGFQKE
jgi:hypothetical protein